MEVFDFDYYPARGALIKNKIKANQDIETDNLGISKSVVETVDGHFKSMTSESTQCTDHNSSSSDLSSHGDDNDPGYADGLYDDENYEYLIDDSDDYLELQAHLDNLNLPPGVEASLPWLVDPNPPESSKSSTKNIDVTSSSKSSRSKFKGKNEEPMDDVLRNFMHFKQFDAVEDYSDHYFRHKGLVGNLQPPKSWSKKIQEEWKILEDNLPDTILVRAYESRMDLLRAAITGPDGTPYHDGLFFFDIMFPSTYPHDPPLVHYHSGGLRLNPNLYNCGKVCLSLLGTWMGEGTELWLPDKSTMLQVLVSIQALILNSRPFFNEPGYERTFRGKEGENMYKSYNEKAFILSLKTMMYSLKNPPKHFGDLVAGHFRIRAPDILTACRVYSEGAEVGSDIQKIIKQAKKTEDNSSAEFKQSLTEVVKNLTEAFINNGSEDCARFQIE